MNMTMPSHGEAFLPHNCPQCAETTLVVAWGTAAKQIGTFSLAGSQMKISTYTWAAVHCGTCQLHIDGRLDGATISDDGMRLTGGHFVGDTAA